MVKKKFVLVRSGALKKKEILPIILKTLNHHFHLTKALTDVSVRMHARKCSRKGAGKSGCNVFHN